jgi:NAD(P)-dependent dehydrogenase (short-subunit alcohol dehydrogenase family)
MTESIATLNPQPDLNGKTALITGASSGIGAATAVALASRGAHILVHYNSNEEGARKVQQQVANAGGSADLLRADLTKRTGTRELTAAIKGSRRPIDILVNNVGSLIQRTPVLDFKEELWDEMLELNLSSSFFAAAAVLPGMVKRNYGFIVNLSSVAGRNGGGIGALAYATCKGAISTMTKGLAREFAPQGIRVNAVSPGTVDTGYHRKFSTSTMLDSVRAATPLKRLGMPEEIASVILFLLSDAAQFIHGQVIEVNGGFYMV